MKKKFKMPHGWIIIIILLLISCALTYIVPAGEYVRYADEATGKNIVDPNSFSYAANSPVSPLQIPKLFIDTCVSNATLIFVIMFITGALGIVMETGMLTAFCTKLVRFCSKKGREKLFIPLVMFMFALLGTSQSTDKVIAFAPLGVMLALSMGYDAIVGIAIVLCGVGVGFSGGSLGIVTPLAQEIAELPLYSGVAWRLVITFILYVVTCIYVCKYAAKVKADPTASYLYGVEGVMTFDTDESNDVKITWRHTLVLIAFVACLLIMVYGCVKRKWGFAEIGTLFIWMGIICGFLGGMTPSQMCKIFIANIGKGAGAAIVVGLGATVSTILTGGMIIDTIVHACAGLLVHTPHFLAGPVMYVFTALMNCLIPSGNGKAVVLMPILVPLSDLIGLSRQTTVSAYLMGDGLCNYILPHAAALMGFLGLTNVPYDRWIKFMFKLFLIQSVAAIIICAIGQTFGG